MSEGLQYWLNGDANIKANVLSYEKEFSNGYYFGKILFNYGLLPEFLDHFNNRSQAVYRDTNYGLLQSAMEKIGIPFDENVQKAIKREELGAAKKFLFKLKSELAKIKDPRAFSNKAGMSEAMYSVHTRTKRLGIQPKLESIERKCVQFEEEYLKQKQMARQQKELDEKKYQELVQQNRQERLTNMRTNHEYMKEWERSLTTVWKRSKVTLEEINDARLLFNTHMTQKIQQAEDSRLKKFQDECYGGIQEFEDNANRLGIELEHDPDRADKIEKAPFNTQALLAKVKAKADLNEISRKQKESRDRYLKLKQAKLSVEIAKKDDEKARIERHVQKSMIHLPESEAALLEEDQESFIAKQRERQYLERKEVNAKRMDKIFDGLKTMTDEEYKEKCKAARFAATVSRFEDRKKEYNGNYKACLSVMNSLFELADVCFQKLPADEKGRKMEVQLPFEYYKSLEKKLLNFEPLDELPIEQQQLKSTIMQYSRLNTTDHVLDPTASIKHYLAGDHSFKNRLTYGIFLTKAKHWQTTGGKNLPLTDMMLRFIDFVHPVKPISMFPAENPNLMPVRISILGDSLVGKKTLAKRLSTTLNVPVIDIDKLIEKAKGLVRQDQNLDEENPDGVAEVQPTGKPDTKDSKKPAASPIPTKKPALGKVPGKKDIFVQLSEAELEFQRFGVKIRNLEIANYEIPDELKQDLILLELKWSVPYSERSLAYQRNALAEARRKAEEQKTIKAKEKEAKEEAAKKAQVKPAGKGAPAKETVAQAPIRLGTPDSSPKEESFEYMYPYTKGFILVGYPATYEQAQ